MIGVAIIVIAVGKFIWDKKRGGGGGFGSLIWPLVIGGLLAGPDIIIPNLLWIAELVINAFSALLDRVTGGQ